MRYRWFGLVVILGCLVSSRSVSAQPTSFEARVVEVLDGDSLEIERAGRTYGVELAEIDCPEEGQPFGPEARRVAIELTAEVAVRIDLRARSGGGRLVGSLRLPDGRDLAGELLRRGLAWWIGGSAEQSRGSATLEELERQARTARRGLWSESDPVPPWVYRNEPSLKPLRALEKTAVSADPPQSPRRSARGDCLPRSRCCRICTKGKACGDSCINARLTCHKGRGCACDSDEVCA